MAFTGGLTNGMSAADFQMYCNLEQYLSGPAAPMATVQKLPFFSVNEFNFFLRLQAAHPDAIVLSQVQLIRILNVDVSLLIANWNAQGQGPGFPNIKGQISDINLLSLDFVLLTKTGKVFYVIELDGPEHLLDAAVMKDWVRLQAAPITTPQDKKIIERVNAWQRDKIKESAVQSCGLPFERFKHTDIGSVNEDALHQRISSRL